MVSCQTSGAISVAHDSILVDKYKLKDSKYTTAEDVAKFFASSAKVVRVDLFSLFISL
jgi:hypothetical protein